MALDQQMLTLTIAQMEKDLALTGISYTFHSQEAKDLVHELAELVSKNAKVINLAYRVDLPMRYVKNCNNSHELSGRLWDRVFKKVWTRLQFNVNNG